MFFEKVPSLKKSFEHEHNTLTTKKKAFYIDSNGLSTSVMTRGGNTVSLNTDIAWRTVFERWPFYIGFVDQSM